MRKRKPTGPAWITAAKLARSRHSPEQMLMELKQRLREISDLTAAGDVLNWDQATYMTQSGVADRSRQCAMLLVSTRTSGGAGARQAARRACPL
jgi:hypothetical protein